MRHTGISAGLVLLLTSFSLVSCIVKDNTLGSALTPSNQDLSMHRATIDLPVRQKLADSLQTAVSSSAMVGSITSEPFGTFHSDAAMSITSVYDSVIWGSNPSVRNIYVEFTLDTALVMEERERIIPQNIRLYQLAVELDSTTIFNNSLGSDCFDPDPVSVGGTIYTGGSTYMVYLKKEFGEKLFKIPMETIDSAELFMKTFYGLYMNCDDPEPGTTGGRLNIFDLSSSTLYFAYDYDDDEGARRTSTALFNLGTYYTLNVCSSGSKPLEESDAREAIYAEGQCGIKPFISAKDLKQAVDGWMAQNGLKAEDLLVAKATVSFPYTYDGDDERYSRFANNLFPCRRVESGSTGQPYYSPLSEISNTELESGTINRSTMTYTSNVSIYLQDLIRRDASEITAADDLWMMGTLSYTDSYTSATTYYADYYYYSQTKLNGTSDLRRPVLEITYSILK